MPQIVSTQYGDIRGRETSGISSWLGIPYAAPPWGANRFQAPQPPAPWGGIREALSAGPVAPQILQLPGSTIPVSADPEPDLLNLNVWAPTDAHEPLPVMVWIHGGAYVSGAGSERSYDGSALARLGAVVVTLNYRLGVDGFGELPDRISNRGLLDQIAALEWVHDNIGAFGGDPLNVTIFGESAGAGSVVALLTMPLARGLFHKAIAQSVPRPFLSQELALAVTESVAREAGQPFTADALSGLDPDALTGATRAVLGSMSTHPEWGPMSHSVTPFGPVVSPDTLPEDPWAALRKGAGRGVPLVIGHNRDEYRIFLALQGKMGKVTEEEASAALATFAPNQDADAYREIFSPDTTPDDILEKVNSDWLIVSPTMQVAEAIRTAGGDAFVYELSVDPEGGIGSPHAIDLPFTFDTFTEGTGSFIPRPTEQELETGRRLRSAWIRFATTGDPGWPAWTSEQMTRVWGGDNGLTRYPERLRLSLSLQHPCEPLRLVDPR